MVRPEEVHHLHSISPRDRATSAAVGTVKTNGNCNTSYFISSGKVEQKQLLAFYFMTLTNISLGTNLTLKFRAPVTEKKVHIEVLVQVFERLSVGRYVFCQWTNIQVFKAKTMRH